MQKHLPAQKARVRYYTFYTSNNLNINVYHLLNVIYWRALQ